MLDSVCQFQQLEMADLVCLASSLTDGPGTQNRNRDLKTKRSEERVCG